MKRNYRWFLVCAIFFYMIPNVEAQDSTKNDGSDKSYFEAGLSYLSNNVFLGRHDSLKIPYLTPSLYYYNKLGFYAGTSVSYLNSAGNSRIDLVDIEAGYAFTKDKLSGIFSIEKDFYHSQSTNVKAETNGSLNGTLSYDFGFVKPLLQGGIIFGEKDDYSAGFGVSHSFFLADDNLEINPNLLINASTQNYYSSDYTRRKFATKGKNRTGAPTTTKAYLPDASKFKIMDYEFSLPVDYSLGKFIFDVTPTDALPVNPNVVVVTITSPSGISVTRTRTEKLGNIFFWSVGITYDF